MEKKAERFGLNNTSGKIIAGIVVIGLIIALATILLIPKTSSAMETGQTRTITDMTGRTIEVPANLSRIVITCCGGATHEVMVMGGSDKIVAQPSKCIMPQLRVIQPRFETVPDAGSFDNVNVEQIVALHPDLVIASITSEKGNTKIRDSGIPVVTVMTGRGNMSVLKQEFAMIGRVLGTEKEASALLSSWDVHLTRIQDRVSTIPADQRKKVYYMNGKLGSTDGSGWWGQEFITAAGGINVAEEMGTVQETTAEQIIAWNPDVIIISRNKGVFTVNDVKNNPQLSSISAVKNGQVYVCPTGAFWWDRPSPESPLGILWLAKTLYPEKFSDIDLKTETRDFYQTFYGYSLSDPEFDTFLLTDSPSSK
ncbi:MAG: ABC transporter substrate-binding protein [Methanoregula sp.]|jgi:iron complex transport system substrate-binding protein|nr:ABC transporter substrate-binding protein [Methanoregula sp.]